jgi:branched-chain amino acid transport system substrate-binding protein
MKNLTPAVLFILFISFNIFPNIAIPQEEIESYHLGVALPLTGTGAFYSKDGINAIQLAAEEINARGGLLGKYPVKLFFRDTRTNPDAAVREATAMIVHNKVRCILGTYSSACAIAVKPIAREHRILHIAAISNSENITMSDFSPYTFLMVPNSYMQANAVAMSVARLANEKGWKNYVTIASDYEWGRSTQENFVNLLKKAAPDLILKKKFWPRLGETEFASYIGAITKFSPDFVYGSLASRDNMIWMHTADSYGFFKKFPYPGSLISVSELISQAETIPRGLIGVCRAPFFAHMDIPMMAEFVGNFKAVYKQYPTDWAVMAYDSVYALKQGIEKAGTIDSEKVKDVMKGMSVETTRGKLFFREIDNQLSCSSYIGAVADDPNYPFPIYKDVLEIKGADSWRSEKEIKAERDKAK